MIFLRFILAILSVFFSTLIIVAKLTNYGSFAFERSAAIIGEVNLIIFIIVIYLTTVILTCITAYLLKRSGPNWGMFSIVCPFLAPIILAFLPEFSENKKASSKFIKKRLSSFTDRLSSLVPKLTANDKAVWIFIGIIATIILGVLGFLIYGLMKVLIHRSDLRYIFLFLITIASITTLLLKYLKKSQHIDNTQTICAKCGKKIGDLKGGLYTGKDLYSALESSIFSCENCGSAFCSDCMVILKKGNCPVCGKNIGW